MLALGPVRRRLARPCGGHGFHKGPGGGGVPQEPLALDTAPEEAACTPRTVLVTSAAEGRWRRRDKGLDWARRLPRGRCVGWSGRCSLPGQACGGRRAVGGAGGFSPRPLGTMEWSEMLFAVRGSFVYLAYTQL